MINTNDYIKLSRQERTGHLDLLEPCVERGGISTNHKGVLAQYLNSTIPSGRILLCHACNNPVCSNPRHLYWGTDKENTQDAKDAGTWKSNWQRLVDKYGYEEACVRQSTNAVGNKGGGRKGKTNTDEHNSKISAALKN